MKKCRPSREIVPLNRAAFRLDAQHIRAGNLEALVDTALSGVLGGITLDLSCVQYRCNVYALSPPS